MPASIKSTDYRCPVCEGRGRVPGRLPGRTGLCPECHGTGRSRLSGASCCSRRQRGGLRDAFCMRSVTAAAGQCQGSRAQMVRHPTARQCARRCSAFCTTRETEGLAAHPKEGERGSWASPESLSFSADTAAVAPAAAVALRVAKVLAISSWPRFQTQHRPAGQALSAGRHRQGRSRCRSPPLSMVPVPGRLCMAWRALGTT
jgi:hypothetical protein